jgi:hypothetical protein
MITPTLSARMAHSCSRHQHPKWGENIDLRAKSDKAGLIVIHRHIAVLQKNLRARQNITRDLQEVIMTLSVTYAQFSAKIDQKIEQGSEQGRHSTQQEIARDLLNDGMEPTTVARLTQLPLNQLPQLEA